MSMSDLKMVLMKYAGRIDAKGFSWQILSRKLGAGLYVVTLKRGERVVIIDEDSDLPKFERDIMQISEALRG